MTATKTDIVANSEIGWLEWHLTSVLLKDHLSLEEGSLWGSAINLLWLGDHDGSVFEVVVNDQSSNSVIF